MTKRLKAKSPILEAMHETASDLNRLGFIDQRKMHESMRFVLDRSQNTTAKRSVP